MRPASARGVSSRCTVPTLVAIWRAICRVKKDSSGSEEEGPGLDRPPAERRAPGLLRRTHFEYSDPSLGNLLLGQTRGGEG